jgi:nitrate/nitrite-specific signal transduction histidine kinase
MHALTTSEFETRLNGGHYDDEFKLLAKDFNKFAATTQTLIHD